MGYKGALSDRARARALLASSCMCLSRWKLLPKKQEPGVAQWPGFLTHLLLLLHGQMQGKKVPVAAIWSLLCWASSFVATWAFMLVPK